MDSSEDTGGTSGNPISITQYELLIMDTSSGASWNIYTEVGLAYTAQFLLPGLLYHFKVRALNIIHYSIYSDVLEVMPGLPPL